MACEPRVWPPVRRTLHAGHDLDLAVDLGELAGCAHRVELLDLHDPLHAQLVAVGGLGLVALHDVPGVRKDRAAGRVDHPAGMVVMEVRDDDVVDRRRVLPDRAQRLGRVAALDALDVAILLAHPHAGAGLDEEAVPVGLDEQEVEAAEDPPALVGGHEPAPQRLRHDAEEAAGIGPEPAGADDADRDPAGESARGGEISWRARRPRGHRRTTRPRSKSAW